MTVIVKRSCNSNVRVKDDSIVFNSFVLKIDGERYKEFKTISDKVMIDPNAPDRNARVLEHILELGLVHYAMVFEEEEQEVEE